jgi:fructosamine-3-kinase
MRTNFSQETLEKLVYEKLSGPVDIKPATEGIATNVYKVKNKGNTYYLRITPYENQSYQPEVIAHQEILTKGAKIPEIIYHRNHCPEINNRSFMIIKEIGGKPVSSHNNWQELKQVFIKAGRDIAKVNTISVDGFGWIERKEKDINKLKAHSDNYPHYILKNYDSKIKVLMKSEKIKKKEAKQLREMKRKFLKYLDYDQAYLSHGDFDVTHIYCDQNGYTGIIDFSDICGTSPYIDLAHFKFFSHPTDIVFPWLLKGYEEIIPLPEDFDMRLKIEGIMKSVNRLSYIAKTLPERIPNHYAIPKFKENIKELKGVLLDSE